MKTLLIDNYDSYTYNLFQLIAEVNGEEPVVILNDATPDGTEGRTPDLSGIRQLGGGVAGTRGTRPNPVTSGSAPECSWSPRSRRRCLPGPTRASHSGSGWVLPAPEPRHGHLSRSGTTKRDLFQGLPQHFTAVRYHSLSVREPLPETLEATAWSEDGVLWGCGTEPGRCGGCSSTRSPSSPSTATGCS